MNETRRNYFLRYFDPNPAPPAPAALPAADPPAGPAAEPPVGDPPPVPATGDTVSKTEHARVEREAQALRARIREFEQQEADRVAAQQTEQERAEARAAAAEAANTAAQNTLRERTLEARIAQHGGLVDPDAVARLLNPAALEWVDGEPTNLSTAIGVLLEARPWLKATTATPPPTPPPTGGPGNPPAGANGAPRFTEADIDGLSADQIAAMSPEDYAELLKSTSRLTAGG